MKGLVNGSVNGSVNENSFAIAAFKAFALGLFIMLVQPGLADEPDLQQDIVLEAEKVNINTADAETLALMLDGVGMSRAEAIVSYREQYGAFHDLDDLLLVRGIGESTLRRNRDLISLE